MKKIMTVCGPISAAALGFTSMHEHILSDCSCFRSRKRKRRVLPGRYEPEREERLLLENRSAHRHNIILSPDNMKLDDEETMRGEVADFKESGGQAIVEVSAPGIRNSPQDPLILRRIAEATGVHIIASTGLYVEDTWPERFRSMTGADFAIFLQDEIKNGICGNGILPGHIKAAYEKPSPQLPVYLRTAAAVAGETDLALQVHLGADVTPAEVREHVVKPLLQGGCLPGKTILCHVQFLLGDLTLTELVNKPGQIPFAVDFLRELAGQGFVLCFTPFGFEADNENLGFAHYPDWYSLAGMMALLREGYAEQLVIGNDVFTKLATRRGGGDGYCRLADFVVPVLQLSGVSTENIRKITVENPARILGFD